MAISWQLWAPPLDPPTPGGLPIDTAQEITQAWWASDPWLCLALLWQGYALMHPPEPAVSAVSTGVQSVSYATPGGLWALAMARADWFMAQRGSLASVPVELAPPDDGQLPWDWWQRNLCDPP